MNLRAQLLFLSIAMLALCSCDKPTNTNPVDTGYLVGLEGNYSIECQVNYKDAFQMYHSVDTTYVGTLASLTNDLMQIDFVDGSLFELRFTNDGLIYAECSIENSTTYLGVWIVNDGIPSIHINQKYTYCIGGFSNTEVGLSLSATKL
ncbi:MAG: hypothetical protein ACJASQ_003952 [Crocinitomicaceae bacterium]|jgi:hypothetical protein